MSSTLMTRRVGGWFKEGLGFRIGLGHRRLKTEELVEEPDSSTDDRKSAEVIDLSDDDPLMTSRYENAVPIPVPGPQYPMVLIEEETWSCRHSGGGGDDPVELALGDGVIVPRQVSVVQDYQAEEEAQAAEVSRC